MRDKFIKDTLWGKDSSLKVAKGNQKQEFTFNSIDSSKQPKNIFQEDDDSMESYYSEVGEMILEDDEFIVNKNKQLVKSSSNLSK